MDKIDLTLRKEFVKNPTRRNSFDDTVAYDNKMGYEDQRRSKASILGFDSVIHFYIQNISPIKEHLEFFGENKYKICESSIDLHEDIYRITGVMTEHLRMEYDSGYGSEDTCDCCGGYRSAILNSERYGTCDKCNKEYKYRNEHFWERRNETFVDNWID